MEIKVYSKEDVYRLDCELGNDKFYKMLFKSKPKRIKKAFTQAAVYENETGLNTFEINGTKLSLTVKEFTLLLNQLKRMLPFFGNEDILTINHNGDCTYITALYQPVEQDDVRITIFTGKADTEDVQNLKIVNDFIISGSKLVKAFNKYLHKHLDVSEDYKTYAHYFDVYFKDEKEYLKMIAQPVIKWEGKQIISATELESYFNSIKDKIIGKTIDKILITGILYNKEWDDFFEYKDGKWFGNNKEMKEEPKYFPWKVENTLLWLDEPVILCFGDTRLELEYWSGSLVKAAVNTYDINRCSMDVSTKFSKNIIGHKLVDIQIHKTREVYFMNFSNLGIKRKDGDDMFEEIWFVFDNGHKLELTTDHCDYCLFGEVPFEEKGEK